MESPRERFNGEYEMHLFNEIKKRGTDHVIELLEEKPVIDAASDVAARIEWAIAHKTYGPVTLDRFTEEKAQAMAVAQARRIIAAYLIECERMGVHV